MTIVQQRVLRPRFLVAGLFLLVFLMGADSFIISPLLVTIAHGYQATVARAALGVTVYAVCYAGGAPFLGPLGERYPAKRLLLGGASVFLVGNLGCAVAPTLGWFYVCRAITGLGAALALPNVWATLGRVFRGKQLAVAMGVTMAALSLAIALGVPLGTAVAAVIGWHGIFWGGAGVSLVCLGVLSVVVPEFPGATKALAYRTSFRQVSQTPHVVRSLGVTLAWMLGFYALYTFLGPALMRELGQTTRQVGRDLMVYGGGNFLASFGSGYLTSRVGLLRSVRVTGSLSVLCVFSLGSFWGGLTGVLVSLLLLALVQGWGVTALTTYVVQLAPTNRTTVMALNNAGLYLGLTLGSLLGGRLFQVGGLGGVGLLAAGALISAVALTRGLPE